jgi:hypothetical protein
MIDELSEDFAAPVPFNSTTGNVTEVRYDAFEQTLYVEYFGSGRGGGLYAYLDVDPFTVASLSQSPSVTRFLNANIKDVFQYEHLG